MKLLFDNHLSHKLVARLKDVLPDSSHVMLEGLDASDDLFIWNFACDHYFTIVTKDSDFCDLNILRGHPPKVIWLRIGNCRVMDIESLIRSRLDIIYDFFRNPDVGILELEKPQIEPEI